MEVFMRSFMLLILRNSYDFLLNHKIIKSKPIITQANDLKIQSFIKKNRKKKFNPYDKLPSAMSNFFFEWPGCVMVIYMILDVKYIIF